MGLGKALVVLGGTAVAAGVVWWWLSQQKLKPKCEDYHTESECLAHGCYWYNGACHKSMPDYHYGCIKDPNSGLIVCTLLEGAGADTCDPYQSRDQCWSEITCDSDDNCGYGAKCWENHCYWLANELLDWEHDVVHQQVTFEFEKRIVGNKLLGGNITFKNPMWNQGCHPNLNIWLLRDGERVKKILDKDYPSMIMGESKTYPLDVAYFTAEAVDGIEFYAQCYGLLPFPADCLTAIHSQFMYM